MKHPIGLSNDEASAIIVDVEQKQFDGTLVTNKRSVTIKYCDKCGVKFSSKNFNYCPICTVHNAKNIDLQDNTIVHYNPFTHSKSIVRRLLTILLISLAFFVLLRAII